VAIVIAVTVAPGPIFLLLFGREFAEVAVFVAMILARPLMVINNLFIIPDVIVAVVGIVDSIVVGVSAGYT
jgi:hypothetical protein